MSELKDFTFQSSTGNNTIRARMCMPAEQPRAILQIAHGIAEHIERYDDFMMYLAENGILAVGNDHLGHGPYADELGFFAENDGWSHVVDDMDILYHTMRASYPSLPYIFFGHSMGSFLTRTYLIRYPNKPNLAIICGTGHQARPAVDAGYAMAETAVKLYGAHRPGEMLNKIAFGSYNSRYTDVRTAYDWLSRDAETVNKYMADEYCGFIPSVGLFRDMMGGVRFITDASNIAKMNKETPILFIAGYADPVGEYGKGVKRAYKAFVSAGVQHVHIKLYPGARHELLNELNKGEVMQDILNWIDSKL